MSILIKQATIIDSTSKHHEQCKDILITDGKIVAIENTIKSESEYQLIEADDLHVSKGWFDSSVSFGEPGFEENETIENGLMVAAKSGFTAIALNSNTSPVADSKSIIEFMIHKGKASPTKLYPIGALTKGGKGENIAELYDMKVSGAVAFGDYNKSIKDANLLTIALQYAQNFDGLILNFPQENSMAKGYANEGVIATKTGIKGIPAVAESIQVFRDLKLLEYTGGKLHIPTITTQESVDLIAEAKKKGLKVTCSVAAHHLCLNEDEISEFNTLAKVLPPLRKESDRKYLINALKKGIIDCIVSDHQPKIEDEKKVLFAEAAFGTINLESFFGSLNLILPLSTLIEKITDVPAMIFGIQKHTIEVNERADITLFNPKISYTFNESDIYSTSKNSIFLSKKLKGKAYGVVVGNQVIFEGFK